MPLWFDCPACVGQLWDYQKRTKATTVPTGRQRCFLSAKAHGGAHNKLENKSLSPYLGECCLPSRAYGCKKHPTLKSKGADVCIHPVQEHFMVWVLGISEVRALRVPSVCAKGVIRAHGQG